MLNKMWTQKFGKSDEWILQVTVTDHKKECHYLGEVVIKNFGSIKPNDPECIFGITILDYQPEKYVRGTLEEAQLKAEHFLFDFLYKKSEIFNLACKAYNPNLTESKP